MYCRPGVFVLTALKYQFTPFLNFKYKNYYLDITKILVLYLFIDAN